MTADSTGPGRGSCFEITHRPSAPAGEGRCAGRKLRVLIVEDDPEMRAFIAEALEPMADVLEAPDFDVAVAQLTQEHRRLDLVIVDCLLPSGHHRPMAGVELVSIIATRWPSLPAVVITGADIGESLVIQAFRSGARDFLRKPFELDDLLAAVDRVTRRRKREPGSRPSGGAMEEALTFVKEHYTERLSLRELATMVAMSRSHFCRVFRMMAGVPFRDYVRELRLRKAQQLLLASKLSLTEIAHEVGFYDLPHFDKAFRSRFRVSPTEFLRRKDPAAVDRPGKHGSPLDPRLLG